jgi:hypothetical protein
MDNILVIIIVILACVVIGRAIYIKWIKEGNCSFGFSACETDITCSGPIKEKPQNL